MSSLVGLILLCILIIIYITATYGYNYESFTDRDKVNYENLSDGGLTPWTIDGNTKIVVSGIIKMILNKINNKIGTHYYFVDFDHINTEGSPCGSIRYTADFFVHDTYLQITKRMITIFTLNSATLKVNVEHLNLSNAAKYPTPAFAQYYGNDLSITDDALKTPNKYIITGIDDSRLDFSKFTPAHGKFSSSTPGMPPAEFNQWILPVGITDAVYNMQSNFPCRNVTNFWDTNGVKVADAATPLCQGIKNTPQMIPLRPYENPTINRQSTDITGNPSTKWLFDATDNISGGNRMVGAS
jgi:hypothetical protein